MTIEILSDDVASQIAAGEVIERPASVVKELIENAIDAEATFIQIIIEDAGKKLIEVMDDGLGIPEHQLTLAIKRHATSKLKTADELFSISTLGFRGEALASIASVSIFEIYSTQRGLSVGGKVTVEGGNLKQIESIGGAAGTTVSVRNLFYNVPARLKFLKTTNTEQKKINELVSRYALAYPSIRFKMISNQKTILQTSGSGDFREILTDLYGVDTAKKMLTVTLDEGDFSLFGFISPISITRSNRKEITIYVNGRWVQDSTLSAAILRAYHTMIMTGRYPMAVLFVNLPEHEVDVNVHPAKTEVRFSQPDFMFSLVQRGVRRALLAYSSVPNVTPRIWQNKLDDPSSDHQLSWTPARFLETEDIQVLQTDDSRKTNPEIKNTDNHIPEDQQEKSFSPNPFDIPLMRLIGQVGLAYLVAEGPDGLYLIDQHAAHERILFEKMMEQINNQIPIQNLLSPVSVQLAPHQTVLLENHLPTLSKLGFDVEQFGPNTYQVRGIPVLLAGINPEAALRVVVEDFEDDETPLQNTIEAKIAARVCKRGAVKAGQVLSRMEQEALLRDLERCSSPRTCPHGRPTMIHLSVSLLEKQFGRKGSI
ncbi:MAG: DNA mismatch repair protein MutL [Anaerolineaceae bacterium]|nr:DNA mismatch repair protein MutL [Anaerolineaceae bacterium]